jgi:hypothetical protein
MALCIAQNVVSVKKKARNWAPEIKNPAPLARGGVNDSFV